MNLIKLIRLVRKILVITLLLFVLYLYMNSRSAQAATTRLIWNFRENIAQLMGQESSTNNNNLNLRDSGSRNITSSTESAKTDDTISTGGRWAKPSATVYINTGNATLDAATKSALEQWNQTGAFTFRQVDNSDGANIVVHSMNNANTNAAGLTKTSTNSLTNHFTHATVYLNQKYLLDPNYGYDEQRIINTAEHELGHAIGLDHVDSPSVMQPAGSFYTIQPADVQSVKTLYDE